jgi:hypothetical protein
MMPRRPNLTEIRFNNITTSLTSALTLLGQLNDTFGPPFVQPILNITQALIPAAQVIMSQESCVNA